MAGEELKGLLDRAKVEMALEPTEGIHHFDVQLEKDCDVEFRGNEERLSVGVKGEEYELTEEAFNLASRSIGLSRAYIEKSPLSLMFQNLNYWYGGGLTRKMRFLVKDRRVVSISPNLVEIVSNMELLEAVEEELGQDNILGYYRPSTNLNYSRFSVVGGKNVELAEGDRFYGGVQVQNSIMGEHTLEISPYVFRQWCSNGAISARHLRKWSRRDEVGSLRPWVGESVREAWGALDEEFEKIGNLASIRVDGNLETVLRSMFHDYGIPRKIQEEISQRAEVDKPKTMYDIYNIVTRIATHNPDLKPIASRRMQLVGGLVVRNGERCSTCHRLFSNN